MSNPIKDGHQPWSIMWFGKILWFQIFDPLIDISVEMPISFAVVQYQKIQIS